MASVVDPTTQVDPVLEEEYRKALAGYRTHLIEARMKAQDDYDKTVLALSGAAIGLSLTIVKDFLGTDTIREPHYLFTAWICWALSMSIMLLSYFLSCLALDEGIKEVDAGTSDKPSKRNLIYGHLILDSNLMGGAFLIAGIVCMGMFIVHNVG